MKACSSAFVRPHDHAARYSSKAMANAKYDDKYGYEMTDPETWSPDVLRRIVGNLAIIVSEVDPICSCGPATATSGGQSIVAKEEEKEVIGLAADAYGRAALQIMESGDGAHELDETLRKQMIRYVFDALVDIERIGQVCGNMRALKHARHLFVTGSGTIVRAVMTAFVIRNGNAGARGYDMMGMLECAQMLEEFVPLVVCNALFRQRWIVHPCRTVPLAILDNILRWSGLHASVVTRDTMGFCVSSHEPIPIPMFVVPYALARELAPLFDPLAFIGDRLVCNVHVLRIQAARFLLSIATGAGCIYSLTTQSPEPQHIFWGLVPPASRANSTCGCGFGSGSPAPDAPPYHAVLDDFFDSLGIRNEVCPLRRVTHVNRETGLPGAHELHAWFNYNHQALALCACSAGSFDPLTVVGDLSGLVGPRGYFSAKTDGIQHRLFRATFFNAARPVTALPSIARQAPASTLNPLSAEPPLVAAVTLVISPQARGDAWADHFAPASWINPSTTDISHTTVLA